MLLQVFGEVQCHGRTHVSESDETPSIVSWYRSGRSREGDLSLSILAERMSGGQGDVVGLLLGHIFVKDSLEAFERSVYASTMYEAANCRKTGLMNMEWFI